ncbi:MAG: exodeoxyribonuclease VII small subunit [Chloroflexi bacterium]|nr:MAG: exodeoxyribonuclease VII small subunit [Chloroflexota bacterium]
MASKKDEPGFEALYQRLEETVARLEQGDLTLEESLALYEEGMKLAKRCQEILQQAEMRITRLQESFSEGLTAVGEETETYEPEYEPAVAQDELPLE